MTTINYHRLADLVQDVAMRRQRMGRPVVDASSLIAQAVEMALASGWSIRSVANTGTHYMEREGRGLRIAGHKRREKSKLRRRRIVSINVARHGWREMLARVIQET